VVFETWHLLIKPTRVITCFGVGIVCMALHHLFRFCGDSIELQYVLGAQYFIICGI